MQNYSPHSTSTLVGLTAINEARALGHLTAVSDTAGLAPLGAG